MSTHDCLGCPEYQSLSRRQFMALSGGAAVAAAALPAWLPRVALAKDYRSSQRDVMISIFLRGAADGLTLCVPYGDPGYYTNRVALAIPRPGSGLPNQATDLDGFFGLPPAMTALVPAYQAGHVLFVHAAGSMDPSRSHFDAQRFMEVGKPNDVTLTSGWLGRHLQSVTPMNPGAALRGVGISTGLQRTLVGGPLTLPIPDLDNFGLSGSTTTIPQRSQALHDMYALVADPLQSSALNTLSTIDLLNTINFAGYVPAGGAVYPANSTGIALKTTAALVKAQVGVEAIAIDIQGWDTHNNQGPTGNGAMAQLMTTLAGSLAAFHTDLFTGGNPTFSLVAMSEFGRRVAENGSGGSDHGHGNAMILMGNCIAGGRVLRQWPGLGPGQLFQGLDLNVTIDYRDILAEIVQQRLGNPNLGVVFPTYTPTFRGILSC
jgi:uncharacterized protein (DUF1501 family)